MNEHELQILLRYTTVSRLTGELWLAASEYFDPATPRMAPQSTRCRGNGRLDIHDQRSWLSGCPKVDAGHPIHP